MKQTMIPTTARWIPLCSARSLTACETEGDVVCRSYRQHRKKNAFSMQSTAGNEGMQLFHSNTSRCFSDVLGTTVMLLVLLPWLMFTLPGTTAPTFSLRCVCLHGPHDYTNVNGLNITLQLRITYFLWLMLVSIPFFLPYDYCFNTKCVYTKTKKKRNCNDLKAYTMWYLFPGIRVCHFSVYDTGKRMCYCQVSLANERPNLNETFGINSSIKSNRQIVMPSLPLWSRP